jgi:hypothetical protein
VVALGLLSFGLRCGAIVVGATSLYSHLGLMHMDFLCAYLVHELIKFVKNFEKFTHVF